MNKLSVSNCVFRFISLFFLSNLMVIGMRIYIGLFVMRSSSSSSSVLRYVLAFNAIHTGYLSLLATLLGLFFCSLHAVFTRDMGDTLFLGILDSVSLIQMLYYHIRCKSVCPNLGIYNLSLQPLYCELYAKYL